MVVQMQSQLEYEIWKKTGMQMSSPHHRKQHKIRNLHQEVVLLDLLLVVAPSQKLK